MKALVKAKAEPGLWLEERPVPERRARRRAGQGQQDRHLRHRHPHLQLGRMGAAHRSRCRWSSAMNMPARSSSSAPTCRDLSVGQRVSGEGHVIGTHSRAARGGRFHLDPETKRHRRQHPRRLRRVSSRMPAFNIVPLPDDVDDEIGAILDPLGNAVHTALAFDLVGEDVLITGAGPIGIMARRGRAPRRRAPCRHHRHQPAAPEARDRSRRRDAGRRCQGRPCRRHDAARHEGGLRRRPRDERRAGGLRADGRSPGDGRPHRDARHPGQAVRRSTGPRSSSSC